MSAGLLAALVLSATPSPPKLIVFGGGSDAAATQASIEANVDALAKVLAPQHPEVLFAAGDKTTRAVQIADKERDETADILGMVFDRRENLGVSYRSSELACETAASKVNLLAAIEKTKSEAGGTIVFGVGHGSGETDDARAALAMWGAPLAVDELARKLDESRRSGPIAFVLGECHSGAFTELAHAGGDRKVVKIAEPVRCVLAAVPKEREAWGCTADVDDPGARAYITLIAEALTKKEADYDLDGKVSLREAHAYAKIYDDTVDLPVSTSELWMRKLLDKRRAKAETVRLQQVIDRARPEDRAVLVKLNPFPNDLSAIKNAALKLEYLDKGLERIAEEIEKTQANYDRIHDRLLDQVLARFPELANPFHRDSRRLLAGDAKEILDVLRPLKELKELVSIDDRLADREEERIDLDRQAARIERWLNAIEQVENETLIRRSKRDAETLDRLIACESLVPL